MPSETFATVDEHFTYFRKKSYSECGTYDDTTGWTVCNHCDAVVQDEYSYMEADELAEHENGRCKERVAQHQMAQAVGEVLSSIFPKYCQWCDSTPCSCPF